MLLPGHPLQGRRQPRPQIGVVPAPVALIGVIRLVVVFKALAPTVVVQIEGKDEFWAIDVVAQKLLLVIGHEVRAHRRVVLVEIGNEVVVFVEPGEHRLVGPALLVAPLVEADVVVVVVVDQVVDKFRPRLFVVAVVDPPALIDEERRGIVLGVHAKRLAEKEEGMQFFGDVDHPARRRLVPQHAGRATVGRARDIGVLPELVVDIVLGVQPKTRPIADLKAEAKNLSRSRQTVVENDPLLIGVVADVVRRPHHG